MDKIISWSIVTLIAIAEIFFLAYETAFFLPAINTVVAYLELYVVTDLLIISLLLIIYYISYRRTTKRITHQKEIVVTKIIRSINLVLFLLYFPIFRFFYPDLEVGSNLYAEKSDPALFSVCIGVLSEILLIFFKKEKGS